MEMLERVDEDNKLTMFEEKTMILLEGNIGASKSTIGKILHDEFGFGFIEEPVRSWKEEFDEDLLDLFYHDQKRWSFAFQMAAFTTRAKTWSEILEKTDHSTVVLERSIYCDRYVFAKNCYESGLMKKIEWQLYCKMWDWLESNWCTKPDKIIYLKVPATICLSRIKNRGRPEEQSIPIEYLLQLEDKHDEWLLDDPSVTKINAFGTTPAMIAKEVADAIRSV